MRWFMIGVVEIIVLVAWIAALAACLVFVAELIGG